MAMEYVYLRLGIEDGEIKEVDRIPATEAIDTRQLKTPLKHLREERISSIATVAVVQKSPVCTIWRIGPGNVKICIG